MDVQYKTEEHYIPTIVCMNTIKLQLDRMLTLMLQAHQWKEMDAVLMKFFSAFVHMRGWSNMIIKCILAIL